MPINEIDYYRLPCKETDAYKALEFFFQFAQWVEDETQEKSP